MAKNSKVKNILQLLNQLNYMKKNNIEFDSRFVQRHCVALISITGFASCLPVRARL